MNRQDGQSVLTFIPVITQIFLEIAIQEEKHEQAFWARFQMPARLIELRPPNKEAWVTPQGTADMIPEYEKKPKQASGYQTKRK